MIDKKSPFYLSDWYVEPTCCRITLDGQVCKVESKVMELLVYFANNPGKVLSREEIERAVGGDTVVGYDALTTSIAKLRKALRDNSRNPQFIATIPKKGYQLIATVAIEDLIEPDSVIVSASNLSTGSMQPLRNLSAILLLIIVASGVVMAFSLNNDNTTKPVVTSNVPSIAILPFDNLGKSNSRYPYNDGITEDITSTISRLSGISVIAKSSSQLFNNKVAPATKIAQTLGVAYLLEGSIQEIDSRIRVNARLIDGSTGRQLWAHQYNGKLDKLFAFQDDITDKIVSHLSVVISDEEMKRIAHHYTTNVEAYGLFMEGQSLFSNHTKESNHQARTNFEDAIKLDPYFARAIGALALTYLDEYRYHWNEDKNTSKQILQYATKLAYKALSIDSQLSQAHWVLANIHLFNKEHEKAITATKQAILLNPNYADAYATLAISYVYSGNPQAAVKTLEKALRLNPANPARYRSALGQAYYFMGEYEDAETVLSQAMERNGNLLPANIFLIATLSRLNKIESATWEAQKIQLIASNIDADLLISMFPLNKDSMIEDLFSPLKDAGLRLN